MQEQIIWLLFCLLIALVTDGGVNIPGFGLFWGVYIWGAELNSALAISVKGGCFLLL